MTNMMTTTETTVHLWAVQNRKTGKLAWERDRTGARLAVFKTRQEARDALAAGRVCKEGRVLKLVPEFN